jgi:hypothetical protein
MATKAEEALSSARNLALQIDNMIAEADDLDLQRILKQIEADLMDVQHKLALAVRLEEKG